jgi:DNA modification methylase
MSRREAVKQYRTNMNIRNRIIDYRTVKASELAPHPNNWRKHPKSQQDAIRGILAEVGFVDALMVRLLPGGKYQIVDGHLRAETAPDMDVPVLVVDLDDAEAAKVLATFDPIGAMAEADKENLDAILKGVETQSDALREMLEDLAKDAGCEWAKGSGGEVVEDEVPEPPAEPVTKPGDLWLLGEHRLLCGDSTKGEDVGRLLGDRKPFLMVTDPPYGVEYDPEWRQEAKRPDGTPYGAKRTGVVENDEIMDWTPAYKLFPGHVAYVWHADRFAADLVVNLRDAKFEIRTQVIWRKPRFAISRGHYHWQHEPCWYAVRKGGSSKWCGDRSQSTVWDIALKDGGEDTNHGTQKPVECMARPIRNHGDKDDDIYDPFLGSGTTLIAAQQLNRRCYGMEISPAYCDVIVKRWENLTGEKARLV